MTDLTPEEVQAQGMAMVSTLHRQLSDALARLAEAEGNLAVLNMRCTNLKLELDKLKAPTDGAA